MQRNYDGWKRALDLTASALGLVLFLPILLAAAIAVWMSLGTPVLFSQIRPGLRGKPFKILKFRTMKDDRDRHGNMGSDADRMTTVGRWLRKSSIDELPELVNVMKGEMSLVGPRPLLMEYLPLYSPEQARRHEVRPGLTGWAQVNGRNTLSWEQKFELDVWYVEHRTMWLDLKIMWLTVRKVLAKEGISAAGEATMSRFTGN